MPERAGERAVGAAMLEPLVYAGQSEIQADYSMANSLMNVGFGAVLGGVLHSGLGALGDWRHMRKGWALAGEYVPTMEMSAELRRLHADKIFNVYNEHVVRLSEEERAASDIAALTEEGRRERAEAAALMYDQGARNWAYYQQEPVEKFYERFELDYQTGELVDREAKGAAADRLFMAMYRNKAKSAEEFVDKILNKDEQNPHKSFYDFSEKRIKRQDMGGEEYAVFLGEDQVRHITEGHPDFTEWEQIPAIIEKGEKTYLGKSRVSGHESYVFIVKEGNSSFAVIASPVSGKKVGQRFIIETAFIDNSVKMEEWLKNNKAVASQSAGISPASHYDRNNPGVPSGSDNGIERIGGESGDVKGRDVPYQAKGYEEEVGQETTAMSAANGEGRTAKVVEINPDLLVDNMGNPINLYDRRALREWLLQKFRNKIIKIADDGTIQQFTKEGLNAGLKKRGIPQRQVYSKLDNMLENALYDKEIGVDERHLGKVAGQKIYYSAAKIGDQYFSIRFKINQPLGKKKLPWYKDHKVTEIEIAPSLSPSLGNKPSEGKAESAISEISLDILKGAVKPSSLENGILRQGFSSIVGDNTEIIGTHGADKARYEVWELDRVIASHDPANQFHRRKDYPAIAQERPYHSDVGEQQKVTGNVSNYNPAFVLNTDSTAQNGPPIVTEEGFVLGGNSRAMTLQLVYAAGRDGPYREMLAARAAQFGIKAAGLEAFERPVLVRVVEGGLDEKELARRSREYNQTTTQALKTEAEAISRGRMISQKSLNLIAEGIEAEGSLGKYLITGESRELVESLVEDQVIQKTEYSNFTRDKDGLLNDEGKVLVTRVLRGLAAPDYDVISVLPLAFGRPALAVGRICLISLGIRYRRKRKARQAVSKMDWTLW